MPLVGASSILGVVRDYRICWITGRFGGHKTSLAFRFAAHYAEHYGYRIVATARSIWNDDARGLRPINDHGHYRAVVIFDEGGLYFSRGKMREAAAYAAKMDVIYLLPSFFPPEREARVVKIQPYNNLLSLGIPAIQYKWTVAWEGDGQEGKFWWTLPSEVYGVYSRQDPAGRANALITLIRRWVDEYRQRYGRDDDDSLSALEEGQSVDALEALETLDALEAEIASLRAEENRREAANRGLFEALRLRNRFRRRL